MLTSLTISQEPKSKTANLDYLPRYEFSPHNITPKKSSNFIITKAHNMDNLPGKAQRNQKKKIISQTFDEKYIAENY